MEFRHGTCAIEKRKQLAHFKKTICDISVLSQLIYADWMCRISPTAPKIYNYVSKITGQHTKCKEVDEIKNKADIVDTIKLFVQEVVTYLRLGVELIHID